MSSGELVHFMGYYDAQSEYHTQLAKMNFDRIFDLTAGVYFYFYNKICTFVCFVSRTLSRTTEDLTNSEIRERESGETEKICARLTSSCRPSQTRVVSGPDCDGT